MSERFFEIEEVRRFAADTKAEDEARAMRAGTEAGRALIRASRTVHAVDGQIITVGDGDVLDAILAIEAEVLERLRQGVKGLRNHPISGYEWECGECHFHFAGHPCHVTGTIGKRDESVDSTETPVDHDSLIDRDAVLALIDKETP